MASPGLLRKSAVNCLSAAVPVPVSLWAGSAKTAVMEETVIPAAKSAVTSLFIEVPPRLLLKQVL